MFMHRIKLKSILSFGPDGQDLELKPLNVLIGPNGSGKSNLIEVIGLLQAAPQELTTPIIAGGGAREWIWRGDQGVSKAQLEVVLNLAFWFSADELFRYSLAFWGGWGNPIVAEEILEDEQHEQEKDKAGRYVERKDGKATLSYRDGNGGLGQRDLLPTDLRFDQSIFAQLKDPAQYPEMTLLGRGLGRIRLYREWSFGRNTPPRLPQKADLPNDFLAENGKNLGMVLNRLKREPKAKNRFMSGLRQLYEGIEDFDVIIEGGTVQVFLQEGDIVVPAVRLSDGTLRYLCLLAILCHPTPPPLVCLEEPELGLHPDVLPGLADLMREASERCQLIVTTHSDTLVDALTDTPESVVVCEKVQGQTRMKRLDKEELSHWLGKYRLGDLWTSGELGGNRW